jgi:diguanylate cyclase (GGDEF)-like protein
MSEEGRSFAERALAAMLDHLDEGALLFEGSDLVCVAASARAAELLGLPRGAIAGQRRAELLAKIEADEAGGEAARRALAAIREASGEARAQETIALRGEPARTVAWSTAPIGAAGRVDVIADRSAEQQLRAELSAAEAKLAGATLIDDVTGLVNARAFESEIDREHRRSQRAWAPYAIVRIAIDEMDKIAAEMGDAQSGAALRRVGEALKAPRREYDLVARWYGPELALLLPGIDKRAVKGVLSRSLDAMRDAGKLAVGREVTFSVGVALWIPPSNETAADVLKRAEMALESAKVMGRGHVEIDASSVDWKGDLEGG